MKPQAGHEPADGLVARAWRWLKLRLRQPPRRELFHHGPARLEPPGQEGPFGRAQGGV